MKKILFAVSIFAALVMSGCRPETRNQLLGIPDDAILLSTENFSSNDTKTAVSGNYVYWVNGDAIDLYVGDGSKQSRNVIVDNGNAYISSNLEGSGIIRGYYPAGTATNRQTADNPAVKIPDEYSYSVSGGRQVIGVPMVATAESGADKIKFYHITAAINVMLKNSESTDLYIDSIVVISDSYGLNHTTGFGITLRRDNSPEVSKSTSGQGAAWRRVKLNFPTPLKVTAGSSDTVVQVPIRPIGIDNLTIKVYCKGGESRYIYSYSNTLTSELKRNEVLTAKVNLKLEANGGHMVEVEETYRSIDMATASFPFNAQNGDTLYGTLSNFTAKQCIIPEGATVTLRNLSMTYMTFVAQGNSIIDLEGTNSVSSSYGRPAIFANSGKTLTIQGDGTLTATGGSGAAAIGCGPSYDSIYNQCGNIIINKGSITANGGSGAAGIGTGNVAKNRCGNITISSGVTGITTTKGSGATASIGRGNASSTVGTVTVMGVTGEKTDNYTYPASK